MPGEQKPHWDAPASTKASAQVRRCSGVRPSCVVIDLPAARAAGWAQDTTALPSIITVQAPHDPSGAQPSFIERSSQSSRSMSRRLAPSRGSAVVGRPFSTNSMTASSDVPHVPTAPTRAQWAASSAAFNKASSPCGGAILGRMVQVEFTIYPFQEGNSPPAHAQAAIDALRASGLDVDVGPLSTTVSGPADRVFESIRAAQVAAVAAGADRILVRVEVIR
jgi:uncharacterized protein YqgV (UPF0045/DUF77 family)